MEERIIELLTRKFANEATADELYELKELIAKSPDELFTEEVFREIWNSKVKEEDVPFFYQRHKRKYQDEFEFEVMDEDDSLMNFKEDNNKRNKYLAGLFCIILFLIGITWLYFYLAKKDKWSLKYTQIISGKGIRKSITLPDGTNVWLNADSRLSFDDNMNINTERRAELIGEAFFDVVHIKDRPFIIHTNKFSVKVLGTAFDIKAYPNDKKCEATLIRGSIELVINNRSKQKFVLKPSEKFTVIEGKGNLVKEKSDSDSSSLIIEYVTPVKLSNKEYLPETSWTQNKMIFENETLEDLAPQLERWFNVKITLAGKSTSALRFTGAFANETFLQALSAMQLMKPFNFTVHNKNITIY